MTLLLVLWLALLGAAGSRPAVPGDGNLLPPDGFLETWKRSEKTRVFRSSDLYGYIDGGAEIYLEFGFEQLTVQPYKPGLAPAAARDDADEFQVEIYRMSDPVAATGIYLMNCGKELRDPSFTERHTLNDFQLLFKRDRYYVIINNTAGEAGLRPAMLEFGRFVASRLAAERPVTLDGRLPQAGLDKGSVRLIRGPYALQSVFTLGDGDILQLGRAVTAVAGNYRDKDGGHTLIVAEYPGEPQAQKAFLHLLRNLDRYLTVEGKSESRLIFKDYENKYGLASVSGRRLTVRVHLAKKPT
jgi:hypothetical protein